MPSPALQAAATDPYASIATPIQPEAAARPAAPDTSDPYASIATPLSRSDEINKMAFAPLPPPVPVDPPQDHKEELVKSIAGDRGLVSYRAARETVGHVENLLKSPAGAYEAAKQFVQGIPDTMKKAVMPEPQDLDPTHHEFRAAPIIPPPFGLGAAAGAFTDAESLAAAGERDIAAGSKAMAPQAAPAPSAAPTKSLLTNPFRAKLKAQMATPEAAGEAASQPIARAGVKATAPTVGASLRSGIDVETPLAAAKRLYQTVDDAAKTDFKVLYDKLDAAQDAARTAAPGSPEEAVAQRNIKAVEDSIADHKAIAEKSGVPNVDKTLAQADAKFAETQANKDFNSKFFGNQSVISGNIAHGAPESINVDNAIKTLENFDKPNKFGISRLQQTSLGKDGAFKLKQVLYDAKQAGQTAMDARVLRNTILKFGIPGLASALGLGYELTK